MQSLSDYLPLTLIAENRPDRADSAGTSGECGKLATGWRSGLDLNRRDPFIALSFCGSHVRLDPWREANRKSEASGSRPGAVVSVKW